MPEWNQIFVGDVLDELRKLPDECVQCVVTSPPYWGLRDYSVDGQIGVEPTIDAYVATMVTVFRQVWRVLRKDGVCWLNLGDSYMGGGRDAGNHATSAKQLSNYASAATGPLPPQAGLKPKDLCGIPWRVAFALQADGWWLRDAVVWVKPNPMPSSQPDRCTSSYEFVFQLTRSARYYFDAEPIKEEAKYGFCSNTDGYNGGERMKRNVWTVPTQPFPDAHFATFPEKLVKPCILAGTSEEGACAKCGTPFTRVTEIGRVCTRPGVLTKTAGHTAAEHGNRDPGRHVASTRTLGWTKACKCLGNHGVRPCLVLDPFMGSGTVGVVAQAFGRDWVGIELNPDYAAMSAARIKADATLWSNRAKSM